MHARIWSRVLCVCTYFIWKTQGNKHKHSFTPRSSFFKSSLLPFHGLLLCSFALERAQYSLHPNIILHIFLCLLLLLNGSEESSVFAELSDRSFPFLLNLFPEFRCFVSLVVGVSATQIRRRRNLELWNIRWYWNRFMVLQAKRLTSFFGKLN
jgi:hypothetical protein